MHIKELIKTKRKKEKMSQIDLANKLGYDSGQFISNWERGESMPPFNKVRKLCKLLDIELGSYKSRLLDEYKKRMEEEI